MDAYTLSQVFGLTALAFRTGSYYVQSHFPDSHRMRVSVIPTHTVSALSYGLNDAFSAATAYGGAAVRAALFSTRFGQKFKGTLTAIHVAAVGAVTTFTYKGPEDVLALAGTVVAGIGDYQPQGRYQRVPYLLGRIFIWIPMAYLNKNWAMLSADAAALALTIQAIYRHDIRNAAGKNQPLRDNIKAYLHGIFFNSATGANIEGQVSKDIGHESVESQFVARLKAKRNPFFRDQENLLAALEAG